MSQLPTILFALFLFAIGYASRMLQDKRRPYWKAPQTPEEWRRLHARDLPAATYESPIVAELRAGENRQIRKAYRKGTVNADGIRLAPNLKENNQQ